MLMRIVKDQHQSNEIIHLIAVMDATRGISRL